MATINFLFRSTKSNAPLNIRLLYRSEGKDYVYGAKTRLIVSKEYWGKQHKLQRVKDIDVKNKQTEINQELNRIENFILNKFNSTSTYSINKDWLKNQLENYYNPPKKEKNIPTDLVNFIDYYISKRKNEITKESITKFNVIKHKMEHLQSARKKQILIKDIGQDFKDEFNDYYDAEYYAQTTKHREFNLIKTFCRFAKGRGLEVDPQLASLKFKKEKIENVYLNFDELKMIEDIDESTLHEYLINAKDWLIISCYLGQRVSDFMRFTSDMIRIENNKHLIEFTQVKTGKLMTVPLHDKVIEILKKRNNNFPRSISSQKYNDYIKVVCKEAGLNNVITGKKQLNISKDPNKSKIRGVSGEYEKWELITSHIGRRSFATNFYGKIPTTYLIYVTGHSSETMFLNYIGKSNKDLAMEITNYF